jgi:hypothetical protein
LSAQKTDPVELRAELGVEAVGQSVHKATDVSGFKGRPNLLVADRLRGAQPDDVADGDVIAAKLLGQQAEVAEAATRRELGGVQAVDFDPSLVEVNDAEQGVDRSGLPAPFTRTSATIWPTSTIRLNPVSREVEQPRSGQLRCHPLVRSAATAGLLPMATPPPPSGSASSMSYRKRRTKTPSPHGSPSDSANDHQITRPAATQAGSPPPHRVRPEAAETSTHHNAGEVFRGACCRTLLLIVPGLFEVLPGILSVPGLRPFGERRLGKAVQEISGGCL